MVLPSLRLDAELPHDPLPARALRAHELASDLRGLRAARAEAERMQALQRFRPLQVGVERLADAARYVFGKGGGPEQDVPALDRDARIGFLDRRDVGQQRK